MPVEMERKLKAQAKKKGFGEERTGAYVYGTMRKQGWRPSREKVAKQNPLVSPCLTGVGEKMKATFYKKESGK